MVKSFFKSAILVSFMAFFLPASAMDSEVIEIPSKHPVEAFLEDFEVFEQLEQVLPSEVWLHIMSYVMADSACFGALQSTFEVENTQLGLGEQVTSVACNADCSKVLTGGWNGNLRVWKPSERKFRSLIKDGDKSSVINFTCFLSADTIMATHGNSVHIFRVDDGEELGQMVCGSRIDRAVLSPKKNYLMTVNRLTFYNCQLTIWRCQDYDFMLRVNNDSNYSCAQFSPSEDRLLVGCYDGTIHPFRKSASGWYEEEVLTAHKKSIKSITFNHDGTMFVTASSDVDDNMAAKLWDSQGNLIHTIDGRTGGWGVVFVGFTRDAKPIITVDWEKIRLWDVGIRRCLKEKRKKVSSFVKVALSPSGKYIATSCFLDKVLLHDVETGILCGQGKYGANSEILDLCFDKLGDHLVTGSRDAVARIWNLKKLFEWHKNLSMRQKLFLFCVAETVRARATVKAFDVERVFKEGESSLTRDEVLFDLTERPKLQEIYESLPYHLQKPLTCFLKMA